MRTLARAAHGPQTLTPALAASLALASLILLAGCASIVHGTTQQVSVG
jgi:hypothetical protein